jgi:hypothetical protein
MTVVSVGDFTVGGVPYELFCEIALEAARRLDRPSAFLCGYINGYYGYLPTAEAFVRGGYEVEWMPIAYGYSTGLPLPPRPGSADEVVETFLQAAT